MKGGVDMEYLGESIKRPFTKFWRLIVGIILSVLPVINLLATGYELRCAKTAMSKKFEMPKWDNFGSLFLTGLLAAIISIIYVIPAIIMFLLIAVSSISDLATGLISGEQEVIASLFSSANITLLVVAIVLLLLGGYVGFSAIIRYAEKLKFKDAFSSEVFRKAFTGKFLVTWLVMLIYVALISIILGFIPFVGNAIASFIGGVTFMTALGAIYKKL